MQPVTLLMSNLNVEANARNAPNALAAAQDTGQSQEIIREGIKIVQTVQASEAMSNSQRVHRKNENDEQNENHEQRRDTFEHTQAKQNEQQKANEPLIRENVRSKKSFEFLA